MIGSREGHVRCLSGLIDLRALLLVDLPDLHARPVALMDGSRKRLFGRMPEYPLSLREGKSLVKPLLHLIRRLGVVRQSGKA